MSSRARRGSSALTDEQEQAASRRQGALLLAAGAGSGKTAVLVERYVRAVAEDGVAPSQILAITFTERAAWEMRERLRRRLQEMEMRERAREAEAAPIGTFHGFCARLLAAEPLAAGLQPGFSIMPEGIAGRLREIAFSDALGRLLADGGQAAVDLLAAYGADRLRGIVLGAHAQLRSQGQMRPALPRVQTANAKQLDAAQACALIGALVEGFGDAYERRKRARAALDFDDLELHALALLRARDDLREQWAQRFQLVMVDEFQDTNPRQLALLGAIERENLFTVGDEWQSIYGFRHAEVGIFRARRAALAESGAALALTGNFRSDPLIIDVVNSLFGERFGGEYAPLRALRESADGGDGVPAARVELLLTDRDGWDGDAQTAAAVADGLPDAQLWRRAEARMLAQRVAEIVRSGCARPGEIAVLMRSVTDAALYERAIASRGLRTRAAVGEFWLDRHVRDLIAYLRAIANPLDEVALYGVLASPLAGLSAGSLALLARREGRGGGLWAAVERGTHAPLAAAEAQRLGTFVERFAAQRRAASRRGIAEVLRAAASAAGYVDSLHEGEAGCSTAASRRIANVRKLVRLAAEFERVEGRDLRGFIEHVDHLCASGAGREPDAPAADGDADAVSLMSIHAAKGLEFPVVCVADLGRTPPGGQREQLLIDGDRVGLMLARLDGGAPEPALDYEALRAERDLASAEEEDRVLYVAMTRARELLLLSGAASFDRWPAPGPRRAPIAWLAPALIADLPARLASIGAGGGAEPAQAPAPRLLLNAPANVGAVLRLPAPAPEPGSAPPPAFAPPPAPASEPPPAPAPATVIAPLPAPAGPGTSLSYTALMSLERCGYRHYLEAVLGMPEREGAAATPQAPSGRGEPPRRHARAFGEIAHRVLERIDFAGGAPPGPAQVAQAARQLGLPIGTRERAEIARLTGGLLQSELAGRIAAASQLQRELSFAFPIGDAQPLIVGTFDLLAREHGSRRLVVDYKSAEPAAGDDLGETVQREFGAQRLIYALAALGDGAETVEVAHWFLHRPQEPVLARFHSSQREDLLGELLTRIGTVRGRAYAVSDRPHRGLCLTCPGRGGLCSWNDDETMRLRGRGSAGGRV